ncbi:MAG: hypothetical protein IJD78_07875 [Clostridia bacterium]|nr:hypothetical protein [Clostridia bacterium]
MRELIVDFNLENPLSGGCDAGYIGENNATKLILKPSSEHLGSGAAFFVAVFMSKGEIFRSEHFAPSEAFEILLGSHLTRDHYLKVQLEGYAEEDMLVCKSPMISEIRLLPSIEGCECEIDVCDYLLRTQIELNSEFRHAHKNAEDLSLLRGKGGKLLFSGKSVCVRPEEKTVELSVDNGEVDAMINIDGATSLNIFTYSAIDDFVIPADAEIKSVELNINHEDMPEWLDMRDMFIYDHENPYVYFCRKMFVDKSTDLTTFCKAYFTKNSNSVSSMISQMLLRKVRITYAEPPAEVTADE